MLRLFRLVCFWQSVVVSCEVSELGLFSKQVDIIVHLHLTNHSRLVLKLNLDFALHLTVYNNARSLWPLFYLWSLRLSFNPLLFWIDRWVKVLACRIYLAVPFLLGHDRFATLGFFSTSPFFTARRHNFALLEYFGASLNFLFFCTRRPRTRSPLSSIYNDWFRLLCGKNMPWVVCIRIERKLLTIFELNLLLRVVGDNMRVHLLTIINVCSKIKSTLFIRNKAGSYRLEVGEAPKSGSLS